MPLAFSKALNKKTESSATVEWGKYILLFKRNDFLYILEEKPKFAITDS